MNQRWDDGCELRDLGIKGRDMGRNMREDGENADGV